MSKCTKQVQNCLNIAGTSPVLIVLNSILCEVRTYTVTVSCRRATSISIRQAKLYLGQ